MSAGGKRKGPRGSTLLILALLLVLLLQGVVLLFYPHLLTGPPSRERVAMLPVAYRDGAVVHYEEELTFRFPPGEADWDDELHVYRLHGLPAPDRQGELLKTYTAQFRSGRLLEQPVEMEISYARELEAGILDPSDGIYIMYYNDLENAWEDVPAWLDRERQVAVFYAPHFTGYGMGENSSTPHPLMTLGAADRSWENLPSSPDLEQAQRILLSAYGEPPYSDRALHAGIDMFAEAFDIVSLATSINENVLGVAGFERFNGISGEIGLITALSRCAIAVFENEQSDRQARLALASSLLTYSLGTWGTQAMNIASIGVFAINYSLTRFGEEAMALRHQTWKDRYDYYNRNRNPHNMSWQGWRDFMVEVAQRSRSPEDFRAQVDQKIEQYLNAYFNYDDRGIICPDDVRRDLVDYERGWLYENRLETAVNMVSFRIRYLQREELKDAMGRARDMLNTRLDLRVSVRGDSAGDPRIRNLSVRIPVDRDQNLWEGVTDEGGSWQIDLTRYGYLFYGAPSTVELRFEGEILSRPITMMYGGMFADVRFDLPSTSEENAQVLITSSPAGAQVIVDGLGTGLQTPAVLEGLSTGEHTLVLLLEGHQDYRATFTVEEGKPCSLHAVLVEEETGQASSERAFVRITSRPSGASVVFDGTTTGLVTPMAMSGLEWGTYRVEFLLEGYDDYVTEFTVAGEESLTVYAELNETSSLPHLPDGVEGYWMLEDQLSFLPERIEGLIQTIYITGGHGSATYTCEVWEDRFFIATATWQEPAAVILPGETVELSYRIGMTSNILPSDAYDASTWISWFVSDPVGCSGEPDPRTFPTCWTTTDEYGSLSVSAIRNTESKSSVAVFRAPDPGRNTGNVYFSIRFQVDGADFFSLYKWQSRP